MSVLIKSLVCECEAVTAGEVRYAVNSLTVNNLLDLRRRILVWEWELAKVSYVLVAQQDY